MKTARMRHLIIPLSAGLCVICLRIALAAPAEGGAPASSATSHTHKSSMPAEASGSHRQTVGDPAAQATNEDRKAQIKAIDEKIAALHGQFKAQADPLQAQLKALRDKLEADLKPLEEQRKALVEQGESPERIALDQEEARQLASLADREKAEIEKLKQHFDDQRKEIKEDFQKRRQELVKKK